MDVLELQEAIGQRMRHGGSLSQVEQEIIDRSPLGLDERAALWLFAWTALPKRKQRAELARLNSFLTTES